MHIHSYILYALYIYITTIKNLIMYFSTILFVYIGTVFSIPSSVVQDPQDTFVDWYDAANLTCETTGIPTPNIQWFKDGAILSKEELGMLIIPAVRLTDRGFYYCKATNLAGEPAQSKMALVKIKGIYLYIYINIYFIILY